MSAQGLALPWDSVAPVNQQPRRRSLVSRRVAGALVVVALGGCGGSDDAAPTAATHKAGAEEAGAEEAELIDPAQGEALVADGAMLIDVRTPAEYEAGHIEGAVLSSLESGDFEARLADLDPSSSYVLYCRTGNRSAAAAALMVEHDFERVYDMGGIVEWEDSGRPVVAG